MHFRPTREHGEDNPNAIRTANVKYKSKKLLKHQPNTNSLSLQNICMDSSLRSPQCIFSMFLVTVLDVWIQKGHSSGVERKFLILLCHNDIRQQ